MRYNILMLSVKLFDKKLVKKFGKTGNSPKFGDVWVMADNYTFVCNLLICECL